LKKKNSAKFPNPGNSLEAAGAAPVELSKPLGDKSYPMNNLQEFTAGVLAWYESKYHYSAHESLLQKMARCIQQFQQLKYLGASHFCVRELPVAEGKAKFADELAKEDNLEVKALNATEGAGEVTEVSVFKGKYYYGSILHSVYSLLKYSGK
jgi:hypothetical protein